MIKPNELRKGNFLLKNGVVIECDSYSIFAIDNYEHKAKEYNPIPLTEEWLKRFGFEGTEFLLGKGNFTYQIEHKMLTWFGIILHPSLWNEVHKFQNLYFALTGEELTFKENL